MFPTTLRRWSSGADPYCQLLLAYAPIPAPVVEKVTRFHLAEAAGTRVFHRRAAREFCFNFRVSRLSPSRRCETRVKRGVTMIIRASSAHGTRFREGRGEGGGRELRVTGNSI